MIGRMLDMLNLDGELMVAGIKLFVVKEELKRKAKDVVDELNESFSDADNSEEGKADAAEENDSSMDFGDSGDSCGFSKQYNLA